MNPKAIFLVSLIVETIIGDRWAPSLEEEFRQRQWDAGFPSGL
jgi:hypothetical protein